MVAAFSHDPGIFRKQAIWLPFGRKNNSEQHFVRSEKVILRANFEGGFFWDI